MTAGEFLSKINDICPLELSQNWDNVGHLIGDLNENVYKVLLCIDLTNDVFQEAIGNNYDTIICYHPVIWDGLKNITAQSEKAVIYKLVRSGINVFSIHTAYDSAIGGVNDGLAEAIEMLEPKPLSDFVTISEQQLYKFSVFIPTEDVNNVSKAMFDAGAGEIGNYDNCGFEIAGSGTFRPLEGANPAKGSIGRLEHTQEIKFETVVQKSRINEVLSAMIASHPYEKPAYDIVSMEALEKRFGIGRYGSLKTPANIDQILTKIKEATGAKAIGMIGNFEGKFDSAAVCAGSCGDVFRKAIAKGCQLYITGEMKHHEALLAKELGLSCICLSHSVSERFILATLAKQLQQLTIPAEITISEKDEDPFVWKEI